MSYWSNHYLIPVHRLMALMNKNLNLMTLKNLT